MGEEIQEAKHARDVSAEQNRKLQSDITEMRERLWQAQASCDEMRSSALGSEERVHSMKELVQQVTVAYARLASTSKNGDVASFNKARLELSSMRLERKLADREAQVTELTHLIRHISNQNRLLLDEISCAQEQIASLQSTSDSSFDAWNSSSLADVANLALDAEHLLVKDMATTAISHRTLHGLDAGISSRTEITLSRALDELHHNASIAERYEKRADLLIGHYECQVSQLAEKASLLEASLVMKQEEFEERDAIVRELRLRDAESQQRTMEAEECLSQQVEETRKARSYQASQVKSLNEALARARMGEASLEAQVARCVDYALPKAGVSGDRFV